MASCTVAWEKKPLKRPRLGQPDDELTAEKVRQGFIYKPPLLNEYESLRSQRFDENLEDYFIKLTQSYNAIVNKKAEINALQDSYKKKSGFKEPSIWHLAAKPKGQDTWFKDLSGNKPLSALGKRFPFLNKKDEILYTLAEFNVPMVRVVWFLKMTNAHIAQQQECGKMKKKHMSDPFADWTHLVMKYLRDLCSKLGEFFSLNLEVPMNSEFECHYRHWQYTTKLTRHLYEEGLLDKEMLLNGLLDIFAEKIYASSFGILKMLVPVLLQFIDGFVMSVLLSRRLVYLACKVLSAMKIDNLQNNSENMKEEDDEEEGTLDYLNCPFHRTVLFGLSNVIHAVLIDCPTALIWNEMECEDTGENGKAYLCGSPLDLLHCSPVDLPLFMDPSTEFKELERLTEMVAERSRAVESHWSYNKCQHSGLSTIIQHFLSILDCLDKFKFEYVNETNNIDTLYKTIFQSEKKEMRVDVDSIAVQFLCHWAVSPHRYGSYRAAVVTRLFERHLQELSKKMPQVRHPFQKSLFNYLHNQAPNLGEMCSSSEIKPFTNLILLFSRLIESDIFSHDQYVSTLVSSGDLIPNGANIFYPLQNQCSSAAVENVSNTQPAVLMSSNFFSEQFKPIENVDFNYFKDSDESKLDFDRIIDFADKKAMSSDTDSCSSKRVPKLSKHYFNVLHFPVPQDDQYRHECNQRQLLLFGSNSDQYSRKHILKKLTKELNKLWSKKTSAELTTTGLIRVRKIIDSESLCSLSRKIQNLVFYDQFAVMDCCCDAGIAQFNSFISGQSNCLPTLENFDFLLGLLEESSNFISLVEFVEAIICLLPKLEAQIVERNFQCANSLTLQYAVCMVGYMRKHHCYFIQLESVMCNIWRSLLLYVKSKTVVNSFSAERCVWVYLHDLYQCCSYIRSLHADLYLNSRDCIQRCLCVETKPSCCNDLRTLLADVSQDIMLDVLFQESDLVIEPNLIQRLVENANLCYAFAIVAVKALCGLSGDTERLFNLVLFCADVTALCPNLNADWLAVFKILCCPFNSSQDQSSCDSLLNIDVSDHQCYQPLTVLVITLISRMCIRLEDFILHVAMPSLLPLWKHAGSAKVEKGSEASAKLTLHLLGKILLFFDYQGPKNALPAKTKGELSLICSSVDGMVPDAILTLLIAILMLDDSKVQELKSKENFDTKRSAAKQFVEEDTNTAGNSDIGSTAIQLLELICRQEWTKRKFLHSTDLFDPKRLLNPLVNQTQAQRLLRMITRSDSEILLKKFDSCTTKKELISKVLDSLTIMNLWVSQMDLQLLLKQVANSQSESLHLVDTIAKSCMEVFQPQATLAFGEPSDDKDENAYLNASSFDEIAPYWLVAPLISRLPSFVQGRVLKAAVSILENCQARRDRNLFVQSSSLLAHQPFLSLVLICLRGQDDQREGLLSSLLKQIQEFVMRVKEDPYILCDRDIVSEMLDALQLRLSLIGGMFDTVCRNANLENWSLVMVQLLLYGIVTEEKNQALFYTCVDILCVLLLSCLLPDSAGFSFSGQERTNEDCKRIYNNVIKKLKKEIGDRQVPSLRCVHQLLPIPRQMVDIIVCDEYGSQPQKGSRGGFSSSEVTQRKGLQIIGKEKLNPWEIIEGYNRENIGLKWSWFQGIRLDYQPETLFEQMMRMLPHDHHHAFNRPPMPGEPRSDPFLETLQVHYLPCTNETSDSDKLTTERLKSNGPVAISGGTLVSEFSDQVQSPRTTKARARKSTRGRKTSSRVTVSSNVALSSVPVRIIIVALLFIFHHFAWFLFFFQPMVQNRQLGIGQPTLTAHYGYYPQQVAMTGGPSGAVPPYGQGQMWSIGNVQSASTAVPPTQYQSRNFTGAQMTPVQSSSGKQAISAMIRGRRPSGSGGQQMMTTAHIQAAPLATGQPYHQQQLHSIGQVDPMVAPMHQVQMQMDARQQLMQESMMEQQQIRTPGPRSMATQQHCLPQVNSAASQPVMHGNYSNYPGQHGGGRMQMTSGRNQYAAQQPAQPPFNCSPNYNAQFYQAQNAGQLRMSQTDVIGQSNVRYTQQPNAIGSSYQMQSQQTLRAPAGYVAQQANPMYAAPNTPQYQAAQQQNVSMYPVSRMSQYSSNVPGQEMNASQQQINYYPPQY
ncbi:Mediator of RNA polymerase II transcription subunit 12-like protein [Trichinella sp. T9]|nr:Mediator of RNA polymerase II transcription subunit 12-like protein [Trichinella sp. T9]